ncbi:MAG: 4-hydroxybenzoate octaprenyltransferase [Rhodospirillales bacterium]|nr:4-hydroxybenzoate octaprenyltransferase [Rhodospirillales bacterium]
MSTTAKQPHTDILVGDWIDRYVPQTVRPYLRLARLDRPIGTWLLLFPCWWSITLAAPPFPSLWLFALFGIGALVMRGAGCTVNDLADQEFDAKVERTATRPLPSGVISRLQAYLFLALQLLLGLAVLLQFNNFAIATGIASLMLVFTYPFFKRFTYWPQAVLGLTFNWGALLGWAVVHGEIAPAAIALYAAGFFWTLGYDTIYAHQDAEDDILVGIKSTALRLGEATGKWLWIFYGLTISLIGLAGYLIDLSWPFYAVLILGAAHCVWQTVTLDIKDQMRCLMLFKSNRYFAWIILAAIIAGQIF